MKTFMLVAALCVLPAAAGAQSPNCKAQATYKAGAALTSFLKRCETDAQKSCEGRAAEKKLAGAAKTSFTKKCVSDAVGQ